MRFAKVKGFLEDEPLMSKKQKIINFLVFASFAMQMIDMPLATLANAVIRNKKNRFLAWLRCGSCLVDALLPEILQPL
jgi:hypothetical protein